MNTNELFLKIDERCVSNQNGIAIEKDGIQLSYTELKNKYDSYSKYFTDRNVQQGERIVLAVSDYFEFIYLFLAIWKIGAVPVPIEAKLKIHEQKKAVISSNCTYYVMSGVDNDIDNEISYSDDHFVIYKNGTYVDETKELPEDLSMFLYTSGTTGLPKCVMFTHEAMYGNIVDVIEKCHLTSVDIFMTPISPILPATITTALLPSLCAGATLLTLSSAMPGKILKLVDTMDVSVFFAVPYVYRLLLSSYKMREPIQWSKVRVYMTSSAFMEEEIFREFYEMSKKTIHSIYCSSEGGAITFNDSTQIDTIASSVGRAFDGVEITILDENGQEKLNQEAGRIFVEGTHISCGYYKAEELQSKVYSGKGVYTGDVGYFDSEGYLILLGRLSDKINVGGYLVNPVEVENVILELKEIKEVLVYGKKDAAAGELVWCKVVTWDGKLCNEEKLIEHCKKNLSSYKIPRKVEFVKEIPKGRYGKNIRDTKQLEEKR